MKYLYFLALFLLLTKFSFSQISIEPSNPNINDTIILTYNAAEGNAELADYQGDVYMHAGLITINSTNSSDWKYVACNWGENTAETKLERIGTNIYQKKYHIKTLYNVPDNEIVLKLAYVFRSADGSLVGRSESNTDIFYALASVNQYSEYRSFIYKNDSLQIFTSDGQITITPYSTNIINIFSSISGEINQPSYSSLEKSQNINTKFEQIESFLYFSTDSLQIQIDTSNLKFNFIYQNDTILSADKIYSHANTDLLYFNINSSDRIYGTGSRAIELDKNTYWLNVYNQADYGYSYGAQNLNISLPILLSSAKYGLFIDNHSKGVWDIGATDENTLSYLFTNGQADVFFMAGDNHAQISSQITSITGKQPLPPIWSLGFIQSKFGYETESEARQIVNDLQSANFPLDAIILDLYWFGNTYTMGNLDWDYGRFPNPQKMMQDFSDLGVKTILISEPYFCLQSSTYSEAATKGYFAKNSSGNPYVINDFWAGSASLLDIFNPAAKTWFWDFYKNRTLEGAAAWWTDLGEPENHPEEMLHFDNNKAINVHNIYSLEWEKMLYENWQLDFPDKRLFNLSRSGFAGMQRYSTFPWSGDIQRSFDGLKAQIPIMLNMGLTGIAYMHSDVGGFTGGEQDNELFIRWIQMGVFAPIFRIHGTGISTEPTSYSESAQEISKKYIQLRYNLLPYNYTLAYQNTVYGLPLARPMDFYDSQNQNLQNINDQYFWGDNLIIAPIVESDKSSRNVILPEGKWINWHNLEEFIGSNNFGMSAPITDIPILVKAGSFIPTTQNLKSTDNYTSENLLVKYFPDEANPVSSYTMFDDDKKSPKSIENNEFELITFSGVFSTEQIDIQLEKTGNSYENAPESRNITFEVFRIIDFPLSIKHENLTLSCFDNYEQFLSSSEGYFHNSSSNTLYVKINWENTVSSIQISDFQKVETNISNKFNSNKFELYPNPGISRLNIKGDIQNPTKLSVFSADGKILLEYNLSNISKSVDISSLKSGTYLIKITTKNCSETHKWVKK